MFLGFYSLNYFLRILRKHFKPKSKLMFSFGEICQMSEVCSFVPNETRFWEKIIS